MSDLFFSCPVCGDDVPRKAKSCPSCGACEKSGWSEDQYLDGIDLPDEDDFHGRLENGPRRNAPLGSHRQLLWPMVALILLVAMLWMTFRAAW